MHTVELYDMAKQLAESMGYQVREENLGGVGGGRCEVAGKKCLFVDISLSSVDQLDQVISALGHDPAIHVVQIPRGLNTLMSVARAA